MMMIQAVTTANILISRTSRHPLLHPCLQRHLTLSRCFHCIEEVVCVPSELGGPFSAWGTVNLVVRISADRLRTNRTWTHRHSTKLSHKSQRSPLFDKMQQGSGQTQMESKQTQIESKRPLRPHELAPVRALLRAIMTFPLK